MSKKSISRQPGQSSTQLRRGRHRTISPFSRWASNSVDADVPSWEDSCLPVDLQFGAPLVERGWSGPFEYHWQLLTHEFSLPNPAAFPPLSGFSAAEIAELARYAAVCGELASSAALRHHGGMAVDATTGQVAYEPLAADRATFEGLSLRFRELHSTDDGGPGFDSAAEILNRRALRAEDARSVERIGVLAQWSQARAALRERPLRNLVARSMLRQHRRDESEANDNGVRPDDVFAELDSGRLIATDRVTPHQEHLFMVSALGLCHLYFGYAVLVRSALGPVV